MIRVARSLILGVVALLTIGLELGADGPRHSPFASHVVVSEIYMAPGRRDSPTEFLELENKSDRPVRLAGWRIRDAVEFTFESVYLQPKERIVVAHSPHAFATRFQSKEWSRDKGGRIDTTKVVLGPWKGRLGNDGERIELIDSDGRIVDVVEYRTDEDWHGAFQLENSFQLADRKTGEFEQDWYVAPTTPLDRNGPVVRPFSRHTVEICHAPVTPTCGSNVTISAKVDLRTQVARLALQFQPVSPGHYISRTDEEFQSSWITLPMSLPKTVSVPANETVPMEEPASGDRRRDIFTASIPSKWQSHRHLIRYRLVAETEDGRKVLLPDPDSDQPNLAYFVYDGLPPYVAAVQPGKTPETVYDFAKMQPVAVYHLIAKQADVVESQFLPGSERETGYFGKDYLWSGTLVVGGTVYDHVPFRARGGIWRYALGKNAWKFNFPKSHRLQATNDRGGPYRIRWDKLNLHPAMHWAQYGYRGEHGLFQAVTYRLFNLMGVEAPYTHYVHFRVIDAPQETGETQYDGDFWGLYLAIEEPDFQFLQEHQMPDGNLYKIKAGRTVKKNQGKNQVTDSSDIDKFVRRINKEKPSEEWWRRNLDLEKYFAYRAVVDSVHHYDIEAGSNYWYFHNPMSRKFEIHPWDVDMTWFDEAWGRGNHVLKRRVVNGAPFRQEYLAVLREYQDLLFNGEQAGRLIDECASAIYSPGRPSFVDADRARWDYCPTLMSPNISFEHAKQGQYYRRSPSGEFDGMLEGMKKYVITRNRWLDRNVLQHAEPVSARPTVHQVDTSDNEFAVDQLKPGQFVRWRLSHECGANSTTRSYEIAAVWTTPFLDRSAIVLPATLARGSYRLRARVRNEQGLLSRWSEAVEVRIGQSD